MINSPHLGCYHNGVCCVNGCGGTSKEHIEARDKRYAEEEARSHSTHTGDK